VTHLGNKADAQSRAETQAAFKVASAGISELSFASSLTGLPQAYIENPG
jgi:hypothetical protein